MIFKDRRQAGKDLATKLLNSNIDLNEFVIIALPRGGVPVAYEMAQKLKLPLDVFTIKKIGSPYNKELAMGAVTEEGNVFYNEDIINQHPKSELHLDRRYREALNAAIEQGKLLRSNRQPISLEGKKVILVDDGIATGATVKAAIRLLRQHLVHRIFLATPVCSYELSKELGKMVDHLFILDTPTMLNAVGFHYDDFSQVSSEEVIYLLNKAQNFEIEDKKVYEMEEVNIQLENTSLLGNLTIPSSPTGLILFAHGAGSSRKSLRNNIVAQGLNKAGFATLLFDLLTEEEEKERRNVFNISLLAKRLVKTTNWVKQNKKLKGLPVGYFGASTGAAAALVAAAQEDNVFAIVSRGGRPDLAYNYLPDVEAPVLLIVGGNDFEVITLNEEAKELLAECKLNIVHGATHLFEEPGALEKVTNMAIDWFNLKRPSLKLEKEQGETVIETIKNKAKPFSSIRDMASLIARISESRVVMLGEATHGTEEFYSIRKMITKKLIEDHGYNFVAVEGDWPDCYRINQFINSRSQSLVQDFMLKFKRWPSWLWANKQMEDLFKWMQGGDTAFYGLDVYSLYESLDRVRSHTDKIDKELSKKVLQAYSCLDSFNRDEISYAKSLIKYPKGCETEILDNLNSLLRIRLKDTSLDEWGLFDLQQNAKIIANAEKYYRAMILGEPNSWNIRDNHMIDTLDALLKHHGSNSKGIVWAHNTHIGDYHATDMVDEGYVNLGGLARERFGMENVALVGFGTYEGEVLAGKAWGGEPQRMKVFPAYKGSYESDFHEVCRDLNSSQVYMVMNGEESLAVKKGHRAIGVVYQDLNTAKERNFVPTKLSKRYDAFIFVDQTTSLWTLSDEEQARSKREGRDEGQFPETWPGGL